MEAQIHGELSLERDVEALVADPSFRDTDAGRTLAGIARRHGFPLLWHTGFELPVDGIDPDFRGPAIPPLAARVHAEFARPGEPVHAALIGRAAASVVTEPGRWADRGPTGDHPPAPQAARHVLVWFGTPASR